MLSDSLLEKIALFYYFSYLDEKKAQSATFRTVKSIQKNNSEYSALSEELTLIRATNRYLDKNRSKTKMGSHNFSSGHLLLPEKSNWGPWFEFRKSASEREFRTLLYSKVLNISEEMISQGLEIPLGTVRYRLGRGLKCLGKISHAGGPDARV